MYTKASYLQPFPDLCVAAASHLKWRIPAGPLYLTLDSFRRGHCRYSDLAILLDSQQSYPSRTGSLLLLLLYTHGL